MAILTSDNFNYKARKPLDNRIMQPDVATMIALKEATLYDGMICYAQDTDTFYVFDSNNSSDPVMAKWRELKLNGDSLVKAYAQNKLYVKDSLVFYDDQLARVVADFTSDSTEADAEDSFKKDVDDDKLVLLTGSVTQTIKPYTQDTQYYRNDLVFLGASLARVVADYVSDNTAATVDDSFKSDIANGNLNLVSGSGESFDVYESTKKLEREINKVTILSHMDILLPPPLMISDLTLGTLIYSSDGTVGKVTDIDVPNGEVEVTTISISESNKYMKQAPDKREYKISNTGSGYTVGDIIETTEIGRFVKITQVGSIGEIEDIVESLDETVSTTGTGAIIDTSTILYVGSGNNWYQLPSIEFPRSEVYEYKQGKEYKTNDIIIYNDNVYLALKDFTSNNSEATIADSFEKDVLLHNLVAIYTDTDTHSFEYAIGENYKKGNLIVHDEKLYIVDVDYTSVDFDTEVASYCLLPVDTDSNTHFVEYKLGTAYDKDILILKDNKLYIVTKSFTATDFDTEIGDGTLVPVCSGGSGGASLTAYKQDTNYTKDSLVYLGNKVARVDKDFTSDSDTDINDAWDNDVDAKNIIALGGSGDASLQKDITANIAAGNIKSGDKLLNGMTFTEFVEKLLIAEIAPTGNMTVNPTDGLKLKGTTVNLNTITANITSLGTCTVTDIEFYLGNNKKDTQNYVAGTNSYTYTFTPAEAITANTTVKVVIKYTKKDGSTSSLQYSKTYTFVNDCYYGLCSGVPADTDILAMSKTTLKSSKGYTDTFNPSNQRIVYAYPSSLGNLSSIKDQNNFEYLTGSYTKFTTTINGETYNVYYLTDPVTATGLKQVFA